MRAEDVTSASVHFQIRSARRTVRMAFDLLEDGQAPYLFEWPTADGTIFGLFGFNTAGLTGTFTLQLSVQDDLGRVGQSTTRRVIFQ